MGLAVAQAVAAPAQDRLSIDPPSRPEDLGVGGPGGGEGASRQQVSSGRAGSASGGVVRVLDKIDGSTTDLELADGQTADAGSLTITLAECRYPLDNPAGDAFVLLSVRSGADETAIFEGWMVASAPALNALDHPRYDVWALRCLGT